MHPTAPESRNEVWRLRADVLTTQTLVLVARARAKAAAHLAEPGHDGPPFAAALAMPVPRPAIFTWAVTTRRPHDPDGAA